jgi:pimeloyl-ACP methyl ester carboxylesterase
MSLEHGVLKIRGVDVAYRTSGPPAGLPVVLIHGWASSGRMWDGLMAGLEDSFRCLAVDLPGHGDSEKLPLGWYSMENLSRVIVDVCVGLRLRSPVLIGHSMGGTLALDLAAEGELRPSEVAVINPVIMGRQISGGGIGLRVARPFAEVTRRVWPMATRLLRRAPAVVGRPWPHTFRRLSEDMGRTTGDAAVGTARAILGHDLTPKLGRIHIPVLILIGEKDRTVPPREGRLAAERILHARLVVLPAGHHPHDEMPGPCLAALRSFLGLAQAA